jgi:hypothetical protein
MIAEIVMSSVTFAASAFLLARDRRNSLYDALTDRLVRIVDARRFDFGNALRRRLPDFSDRLAVVPDFLPGDGFSALRTEAEQLGKVERNFVPAHKKGGTIAYETLIANAPNIVSIYHSPDLIEFVSRIVGARIQPTPVNDQSSLSLLFYDKPGDHIGWHFDHNFYRGRHFTVLIAIHNEGRAAGGLSHAVLNARAGGSEFGIGTPPNTMVVFEGAQLQHKVTPILQGERRLVLSMTYCEDPGSLWWQGIARRIKDTAFFGVRALWT